MKRCIYYFYILYIYIFISICIYGKFISLYDLEYKNKLNENKHWTVATRKDKEAVEDFYLNQNVLFD